jgi:hypothetical protein
LPVRIFLAGGQLDAHCIGQGGGSRTTASRAGDAGTGAGAAILPRNLADLRPLVSFAMPSNFSAVFENTNGGHYIREAVLKGESAQAWTQMIMVTGEKGVAGNPDLTGKIHRKDSPAISPAASNRRPPRVLARRPSVPPNSATQMLSSP